MTCWRILEPRHSGHRLWYVRLIADFLSGVRPHDEVRVLTTPDGASSREWATHLGRIQPDVLELDHGASLGGWYRAALADTSTCAHVVIPDGEPALPAIARARVQAPTYLLLMRSAPQAGLSGRAKFTAKLTVGLLARIRNSHQVQLRYLVPSTGGRSAPLDLIGATPVPDPVSFAPAKVDPTEWRSTHGLPSNARLYLLAGAIGERKRAREIIEAFVHANASEHITLVLAGSHDAEVRRQLATVPPDVRSRIVSIDDYVSDGDLDTWIQQAQVLLLLYSNVGSSGLLQKAAVGGISVAVPRGSNLEELAISLGMHVIPVPIDHAGVHLTFCDDDVAPAPVISVPQADASTFAETLLGFSRTGSQAR